MPEGVDPPGLINKINMLTFVKFIIINLIQGFVLFPDPVLIGDMSK